MKIRIRFEKKGCMKFIGHLDTMRFFQKLMRLSGTDIRHSEGFSPHPIMSFAAPLGVGIESEGEYMDIEVNTTLSSIDAINRLNQCMPEGLFVRSYRRLPGDAKPAMSMVSCADYLVVKKDADCPDFSAAIRALFTDADAFFVEKKTKKSITTLNLKDFVHDFRFQDDHFFLRLSAGSEQNIKPSLLLDAFFDRQGMRYDPIAWQEIRLDVYAGKPGENLRSLESFGEEISLPISAQPELLSTSYSDRA